MFVITPIIAVGTCAALWLVLGRPRYLPQVAQSRTAEMISVIIPARNEEANLATLLKSIREQEFSPHEVIVVDDDSEDDTAAVALSYGADVIHAPKATGRWIGKTHACHFGAANSTGQWLLFLDADTKLEPGAMAKFAALTVDPQRVSSICPYHTIVKPYEELSAFFNVVTIAAINAFGVQRNPSREAALFGQCLLISKEIYDQAGGHEAVRGEILENFSLARHLEAIDSPRDCYLGYSCISMRMFPGGLGDLWNSWKKGFATGAKQTTPRALVLVSIWITGAMIATFGLATAVRSSDPIFWLAAGVAYLVHVFACHKAFRLAGNFSLLSALLFPIPLFFYQALFFTSLAERWLGIKSRWKGRDVD